MSRVGMEASNLLLGRTCIRQRHEPFTRQNRVRTLMTTQKNPTRVRVQSHSNGICQIPYVVSDNAARTAAQRSRETAPGTPRTMPAMGWGPWAEERCRHR